MRILVDFTACFLFMCIVSHTGLAQESTTGDTPVVTTAATADATSTVSDGVTSTTPQDNTTSTPDVTTPLTTLTENLTSTTTTPIPTRTAPIESTTPLTTSEATTTTPTPPPPPSSTPDQTQQPTTADVQSVSTQTTTASSAPTAASTTPDTESSSPSTSSVSAVSDTITSSPAITSSIAPETSSVTLSTSTTTPATTTLGKLSTKFPSKDTTDEISHYVLSLSVGAGKFITSTVNSTLILKEIEDVFKETTGFSEVKQITQGLPDDELQFDVLYSLVKLNEDRRTEGAANQTQREITAALQTLNASADFNVSFIDGELEKYISDFAAQTTHVCAAVRVCELGYVCKTSVDGASCLHLCEFRNCGSHGQCELVISGQGEATTQCKCIADDRNVYSGDDCQYMKMHPDIMMAIIGGVLGGICFLLLVVIYCICCRSKRKQEKMYTLNQNAHYNESYESPSNLQMKNV